MTDYPEPMNNPYDSMADDVREIMLIRELFERPVQLLGVSAYEMSNQYMPRLHRAIGDTVSYRDLLAQSQQAQEHMKQAAIIIGEMRLRLQAVANAVQRAGNNNA